MAKYDADDAALDRVFGALADPTRRAVIARLVQGPASLSQLAEPFAFAMPTMLQHLRVLEAAALVSSQKVGRVRTYQLVPDATAGANNWIVSHRLPREQQLDRLGEFLVTRSINAPQEENDNDHS
ncbi:MAG: metalloregulator ArsR/SmtB family transcription factor [Patulibacter sp.]